MAYDRAPFDDRQRREAVDRRLMWDRYARTNGKPEVMCVGWLRTVVMPVLIEEIEVQHRLHAEHRDALRDSDGGED